MCAINNFHGDFSASREECIYTSLRIEDNNHNFKATQGLFSLDEGGCVCRTLSQSQHSVIPLHPGRSQPMLTLSWEMNHPCSPGGRQEADWWLLVIKSSCREGRTKQSPNPLSQFSTLPAAQRTDVGTCLLCTSKLSVLSGRNGNLHLNYTFIHENLCSINSFFLESTASEMKQIHCLKVHF